MATVVDTVVALRNARATARIPAADWLATHISSPSDLGGLFRELSPAIERLARARPLELHGPGDDLPRTAGSLDVVLPGGGDATILPSGVGDDAASLERTRLEKELAEAERFLDGARARLANEAFTSKAPPAVVAGARAREAELTDAVARLRERLGR